MSETQPVVLRDHTRQVLAALQYAIVGIMVLWLIYALIAFARGASLAELDQFIIEAIRDADLPERMKGPRALEEAMRDFTALGGYAVLIFTVLAFSAVLLLHPPLGSFWFFALTCIPGYFVGMMLKALVSRDRPSVVPHLSHVGSSSFPSVHSLMSAVTFLTIGLILAQHIDSPALRRLLFVLPLCLTLLVGISRICMGVHYPTDVLGGWSAGLCWTWLMFRLELRHVSRV